MADELYYTKDGIPYARESRILEILKDPDLEAWRKRIGDPAAEEIKATTARAGSKCHAMIADTLHARQAAALHGSPRQHKMPKLPSKAGADLTMGWNTWCRWYDMQPDTWVPDIVEQTAFYSGLPRIAGTIDCAETRTRTIIDWKFTGRITDKNIIQLHYYAMCLGWDVSVWVPPTLRIVRIDPTLGIVEPRTYLFSHDTARVAMALAEVYTAWFFLPMLAAEAEIARVAEQDV